MPTSPLNMVIQHHLAGLGPDGMTDGELLTHFVSSRDDNAFAALVRRHASMVWGVCRRLLNHHNAEDAFQATFVVLVRKAADVPGQAVANWLYGVARQTAVRLRATAAKRGRRETQVVNMPEPTVPEVRDADLQRAVDEELSRLPGHYRGVVVLCDLEGMTRKEAARQLGIPEGSVASRLARARALLAKRLARRGVAFSGGSVAAVLSAGSVSASAPPTLIASTIKAASLFAAGQAAATGAISVKVAALTEGVLKAMFLTKLKALAVVVLLITAVCAGATALALRTQAADPTEEGGARREKDGPVTAQPQTPDARKTDKDDPPKAPAKADKERLQGTWVKVSEAYDGKTMPKEDMRPSWLNFDGNKATFYGIDLRDSKPEKAEYKFALDTNKNPKTIEFTDGQRVEGPRTKAPEDYKAIYKFEDNLLTMAVGKKGLPTDFKPKEGDGVGVVVLKREGRAK